MSDKVRVDKIKIIIGRKTLELTPEELNELRDTLDEVLPRVVVNISPSAPIVIERPVYPKEDPWRPFRPYWVDEPARYTCDKSTGGTLCLSNTAGEVGASAAVL